MLFLIMKQTKVNDDERDGIEDQILGRKVPMIVFIQNKNLVKKIYTDELPEDEAFEQELKLQAQVNEFVH